MKRKLSALLALVLAVVMVFPTAVFVGAAEPALTAKLDSVAITSGSKCTIPVGKTFDLVFEYPAGYTMEYSHAKTGNAFVAGSGKTYTVKGMAAGEDEFTFTAKAPTPAEGEPAGQDLKFVLKLECIEIEIDAINIYGKGDASSPYTKEKVLDGSEKFATGNTLTLTHAVVMYNYKVKGETYITNRIPLTASNTAVRVYNTETGSWETKNLEITLKEEYSKLEVTFTDTDGVFKTEEYPLNVTSNVDSITINKVTDADIIIDDNEVTEAEFKERFTISVKYTTVKDPVVYEGTDSGKYTIEYYKDAQCTNKLTSFSKDAYFKIIVDDASVKSTGTVKSFFTYGNVATVKFAPVADAPVLDANSTLDEKVLRDRLDITVTYVGVPGEVKYNGADKDSNSKNIANIKYYEDSSFLSPLSAFDKDAYFTVEIGGKIAKSTKTVSAFLNVQRITSIVVEKLAADKIPTLPESDPVTAEDLQKSINLKVKYSGIDQPVIVEGTDTGAYTIKFYEDSAYKTVKTPGASGVIDKNWYFTVTINDFTYKAGLVSDYLKFDTRIPVSIQITWGNDANKTYEEGYVLGTKPSDWHGLTVSVKFETVDNAGNKSYITEKFDTVDEIEKLKIVLSGFAIGKQYLEVKSVLGINLGNSMNFDYEDLTILQREVEGITLPQTTLTYTEGDKLDLTGIKATLNYNFGEDQQRAITNDEFTCSPRNGAVLKTGDDRILVVYKDPTTKKEFSGTIPLKVTAKPAEGKTIKEVKLLSSANAKREYFIGETFDKTGFEILLVYSDATTEVKDLSSYSVTVDSNKYSASKGFTAAMNGDLKVKFNVSYNSKTYEISMTLPGIEVTKRPTLQSIVATSSKDAYMLGESPEVQEITITAKYDDNSTRVFTIDDSTSDANRVKTTYTITTGGVTYTMKLTPTKIDDDTKSIRVAYTEKVSGGSTTTKNFDIEIEVIIPEAILSYYDSGWKYEPYMDFDEALDEAEEYADDLSSSYQKSRKPSIQLCKDITVLYDYSVTEYMEIDLNGFDLTMDPGEIFVKSTSYAEITFVNNGDEDSKIVYSKNNDDDNIIIAPDDSYVIDADTGDGKYEVTITKPTGGKVSGPEEVTHGHDAKFTLTPDENYEVKTITVKEGKTNKKYENKDNVVTVTDVQGELTVTVTFQEKAWENPFTDIYKSATYYKSIQFVYENGLFTGTSATKFEPETTMNRAMFVTVLGRLAGIDEATAESRYGSDSSFPDVEDVVYDKNGQRTNISWAIPYINWADSNGLLKGYEDGTFRPTENITHIQMYVLMQRYASLIEKQNTKAAGTHIAANDVKDIPKWDGAYEAVEYASKNKFLVLSSNRLTPNGNAKRSELAMLLEKFCENVLDWEK